MSGRTRILLIDSSTSDIALASLLLQRALPRAEIACASDSASLLAASRGAMPDLVVVAPKAHGSGFGPGNVLELVRTTWPRIALVVFGRPDEIARCVLAPAATLHGIANKTSAGFMALPAVVRDILDRFPAPPRGGLDGWPLPAVRICSAGGIRDANAALGEVLGVALDELLGTPLAQHLASGEHERWHAFRAGGQADIALRLAGVAGRLRVARDAGGELLGCLVEAPECSPAALPAVSGPAALRELQDMALVVSHDLKEPVQQVLRLVQRLDDARGSGPRADDKLLGQLRDSAAHAASMLDALLAYLSVSGRESVPGPVDLNQCFEEALHNLRPAIEESQARISAAPLPTVTGDAEQMVHLLQNLLANAIKFRSAAAPLVHITSETRDGRHRIAIHDNGIGIGAAYRERVFEMGKRLHTQEEFPGTGMGLALCRRIMERHGGAIRIDAGPRGGSVVVVELPSLNAAAAQNAGDLDP